MAQSLNNPDEVKIYIPEAVTMNGVTQYVIQVRVGKVEWTVQHRYREFKELHSSLLESGVDKSSLPEGKLIGNKDPSFIKKRRRDLEVYLQSVFSFLRHSLPPPFVSFLSLPLHDLHYILRSISSLYYDSVEAGEPLMEADWTPLEMHAVSERLKAPRPPEDADDERHDFVNVADLACQMKQLSLRGGSKAIGSSNVVPDSLTYDFLAFKTLTKLKLTDVVVDSEKIATFGMLRKTLVYFTANRCGLRSVADLLLGDTPCRKEAESGAGASRWTKLMFLDLRENQIEAVDDAISLAPQLRTLLFGANGLSAVENLSGLNNLCTLELADNRLERVDDLHAKLGQISKLDLSNNKLSSLAGCSKLYSLVQLNVSGNRIYDLDNVFPISKLPNLESLNLQGNQVTTVVDYRIKVFEAFGKRCSDLCLDNELPTQQEIDKVSVLMALRVAREGKSPTSLFGNLPRRV